jgi:hypothetical protein
VLSPCYEKSTTDDRRQTRGPRATIAQVAPNPLPLAFSAIVAQRVFEIVALVGCTYYINNNKTNKKAQLNPERTDVPLMRGELPPAAAQQPRRQ